MRPVFAKAQWLFTLLAVLLFVAAARAAEDKTVHLTVEVTDEMGKPVPMARVNVYQEYRSSASIVARPPDDQTDTNAQGLARLQIVPKPKVALQLTIEVGREDMQAEFRSLDKGMDFPTRLPLEKFSLKAKSKAGTGEVVNVGIEVVSAEGPVAGANVVIVDPSLGAVTGRFPGTTGADGRVTIPVLYGTPDSQQKLGVQITKNGYKDAKMSVTLNRKDAGKTVEGGTATLEKTAAGATKVAVTVINKKDRQGVDDATVVLDGPGSAYHSDTTRNGGNVIFYVSEAGTFKVRITQDNFLKFAGETRVVKGEQDKSLTFELEPKMTKDQGEDTIEVTVLGKDSTDDKSKASPVKGASVKAGSINTSSDENGKATLTGAFEERQEIRVEADGYKPKNASVSLNKTIMSAGSGKIRVTLDPELSDKSPIRLRVEVRDSSGKAVPKAKVELSTAGGEFLTGAFTGDDGNFNFDSNEFDQDLAVLRKGLLVSVRAKNYQEVLNRSVPGDLFKPSTETRQFIVQLDKGWDALLEAINALEPRVLAWNNELTLLNQAWQNIAKLQADVKRIGQKAAAISDEIDEARKAFTGVNNLSTASMRCDEAARLKTSLEGYSKEAAAKEKELDQALEKAKATAATCSQATDADEIRKLYEQAIKLTGAIGVLEKKAAKDGSELKDAAKQQTEFKQIAGQVETKVGELAQHATDAEGVAASAGKSIVSAQKLNASLKAGHTTLTGELAKLKTTHGLDKSTEGVPADLLKRVETMEGLLRKENNNVFASPSLDSTKSIQEAAAEVKNKKEKAESLLAGYKRDKKGGCDIEPMDNTVEAIGTIVTSSSFDLGLAATLADDCAKKIAAAANQVEVPDLSTLNDLGAMTRAAEQVGMVLHPAATSATPPSGSQRLFGPQSPLAKSKANRGDTLTILVYQKLAQKLASPTPSPTDVASASPKPAPGDEYVDVPSVANAKDTGAMSKMLAAAGFKAVFNAATPKKKEDELKYAGQDPVGRVKKSEMQQRGNQVTVLINQSWQPPQTTQATPTPEEAKIGTMPNLIDLTLEQAASRLTGKMRMGGDQVGDKPPTPEKALRVYAQNPPPFSKIDIGKEVVVTVKRYGSAQAAATPFPTPGAAVTPIAPTAPATVEKFDGTYSGSYSGDSSGPVKFSIAGGAISIRSPGSGSGTVSSSGSANFSGAGTDTGASYTFTGRFSVSGGKASASGSWRARSEYGNYSGTWRASR